MPGPFDWLKITPKERKELGISEKTRRAINNFIEDTWPTVDTGKFGIKSPIVIAKEIVDTLEEAGEDSRIVGLLRAKIERHYSEMMKQCGAEAAGLATSGTAHVSR